MAIDCVSPGIRRRGVGRQSIEAGPAALGRLGAAGCVVVGDPACYRRFGFEHDPGLTMEGVPPEVLMSLPMASPPPRRPVSHHPAFLIH